MGAVPLISRDAPLDTPGETTMNATHRALNFLLIVGIGLIATIVKADNVLTEPNPLRTPHYAYGAAVEFYGEANANIEFVLVGYCWVDPDDTVHQIECAETTPQQMSDMKYYFGGTTGPADQYWDEKQGGRYVVRARFYLNRDDWVADPESYVASDTVTIGVGDY
jgi:hypothetical protein